MQKYNYQALTPDGKTVRGTMIANNDEELKQLVGKAGNTVVKFTKIASSEQGGKDLPLKLIGNFCSQLGAILKAGLPLASALAMLYGKTEAGPLKKSIGKIYEMVQKGNSLSDALAEQGKAYPPLMLNMVKAGEMSGDLDSSLNKLSLHFEKEQKTKNAVKAALRYPKMLAIITFAVVVLMVAVVLPKMTSTMDQDNLPGLTKALLGLSDFIVDNFIFIAIAVVFPVPLMPTNMIGTGLFCSLNHWSKSNSFSLRTFLTASLMDSSTTSSRVWSRLYFLPIRFSLTPFLISSTTGSATSASRRAISNSQRRSSSESSLIFFANIPSEKWGVSFAASFAACLSSFFCSFFESCSCGCSVTGAGDCSL